MRTFIAIDLDEAIRRQIGRLQEKLTPHIPGIRWIQPDRIHMTLKFLGEVDDRRVPEIGARLDELARSCRPFEISVRGAGVFPPHGRVNVIWVGVEDESGALAACQAKCEELISPLGFPREHRAFSPHLTLARNKDPRRSRAIREALAGAGSPEFGILSIEHVTLYLSTPSVKGSEYQALSRHELRRE